MAPLKYFVGVADSQKQKAGEFSSGQFDWNAKNKDDWNLLNMAVGPAGGGGKCQAITNLMHDMLRRKYIDHHMPATLTSSANKRKRDGPTSERRQKRQAHRNECLSGGRGRKHST